MTPVARRNTMLHFDEFLKPSFYPSEYSDEDDEDFEPEVYHCPVPGLGNDPSRRITGGHLELSLEEMKGIFEPTFEEISGLVQQQISLAESRSGASITVSIIFSGRILQ